jgi:hypothetical protein
MTAQRPTWAPIVPEYQTAPGDWLETKTAPLPIPTDVGADCLMALGAGAT